MMLIKKNSLGTKLKAVKVYFNLVAGNKEIFGTNQMYASSKSLYKGRNSIMKDAKSLVEE